ncbi:MAG TPA: SlyX family protein [Pusillimonas sp.]|uniref:SlyX family protein n=1 Tax=unclassified Pusillimonas TaxID=2640016 RepID=UPI0026159CA8|nr:MULTISPECIES: SlyX family protein [unclassified Pusillimonas]HLU19679.1 SlyX family protein [Pusillimonas sp.]
MDNEKRLVDIELKLIAQEDLTQQLNDQVVELQKELQELQALYRALVRRINEGEAAGGSDPYTQERPPHY